MADAHEVAECRYGKQNPVAGRPRTQAVLVDGNEDSLGIVYATMAGPPVFNGGRNSRWRTSQAAAVFPGYWTICVIDESPASRG